jgi:arsenate reductase (glutaredoxin)
MSNVTIYHNPACGTSRNTLEMIRNSGTEPTVIHYLENPPSRDELVKLIADMGIAVRRCCCVKMLSHMKNLAWRKINLPMTS